MIRRSILCAFVLAGLVTIATSASAVPNLLQYQGRLTNAAGAPLTGSFSVVFSVYNAATGGSALYSETDNVTANNGLFNVVIGGVTPLPAGLFDGANKFLGIKVGTDAEMTPRWQITSVGYALRAGTAEGLSGGGITGADVQDGSLGSIDLTPTYAHSRTGNTTTIGSSWTNYSGAQVTIDAPGPGYVVVDATFWLLINHTNGVRDFGYVGISPSPTGAPNASDFWAGDVGTVEATASGYPRAGHVQSVFAVVAGPQTYYLNGEMLSGQDAGDVFWFGSMSAIYYYNASPTMPDLVVPAGKLPR